MKKNQDFDIGWAIRVISKIPKTMRLLMLIVVLGLSSAYGRSFSQAKVNVSMENVLLKDVFAELTRITGYDFVYSSNILENAGRVTVKLTEKGLEQALEECLRGTGLGYKLEDKFVIISPKLAQPQTRKSFNVMGIVKDKKGVPLPGVSVMVKNGFFGVSSDVNGNFSLTIPEGIEPVVVFSFVGMKKKEVSVTGDQKPLNIVLEEDIAELGEVVVTGYQNIKRNNMVGSTNSIKREELFTDGTNSIEQMLQGKLPGMVIKNSSGMVGSRQKVKVRGTSTLLGNQEPVWVVDGIIQEDPIPFKAQDLNTFGEISSDNFDMVRNFVGNAISWLNPNDIENITVLKDASATVLYGVKAANGVIVITTRKGQAGRMSVRYSGNISIGSRITYDKMNLMNSKERIDVSREIYGRGLSVESTSSLADVSYEGALKRYLNKEIGYDQFNAEVRRMETGNTDWFDLLYRNPVSHNHSLSISGGTDKIQYYWSINGTVNNGAARGNDSKMYGSSLNLNAQLNKKLMVSAKLSASINKTNGYYQVDPYQYATRTTRTIPCFTEEGDYYYYKKTRNGYNYNVLNELENTGNTNQKQALAANVNLRYDILSGLRFESVFGLNYNSTNGQSYASERSHYITTIRRYEFGSYMPSDPEYKASQLPHGGELNTDETRNLNYTWRNQISLDRLFHDKHRLSVMIGQEVRSNKYDGVAATTFGYFPDRGKTVTLPPRQITGTAGIEVNRIYDRMKTQITDRLANYLSFYGTATYAFDERYVVTASMRSDASNRFGQDTRNRFLPIWSVGGRWNVAKESWMANQQIVNELNLRGSFGWQGNVAENFGPDLITRIPDGTGTEELTGNYSLMVKSLPYGNLRWEKVKTINLGVDLGFFKNRLTAMVEYYHKVTEDVILQKEVPYAYGVTSMPINGGRLWNKGWELSVTGTPVRTNNFTWTLSLNTAKNINQVDTKINQNKQWRSAVAGTINKEGFPVGSIWAFEFLGLNPENGSPLFQIPTVAENPEAERDATAYMKFMGSLEPDFSGGISTSFRYKTLTLSASFTTNIGGKCFLAPYYTDTEEAKSVPSAYTNLPKDLVNRWRNPGDERFTNIPSISTGTSQVNNIYLPEGTLAQPFYIYGYSDVRVVSASFFRCNNITLSYNFPEAWVKKLYMKDLSLTAGVTNPFIIVSNEYKGMDPEVATGSQPIVKTYSLGLNVSF